MCLSCFEKMNLAATSRPNASCQGSFYIYITLVSASTMYWSTIVRVGQKHTVFVRYAIDVMMS